MAAHGTKIIGSSSTNRLQSHIFSLDFERTIATYISVGLKLDTLDSDDDTGGLSRSPVTFASPLTLLTGSWGLSNFVLRKILLIITELAINTMTSPFMSSLSIIHRR